MVIVCTILFLSVISSLYADKKDSKLGLIITILLLGLLSGLRSEDVGIDTTSYYSMFWAFYNDQPVTIKDLGFKVISKGLMHLFDNPSALIFIYSFLTNLLIIVRLWETRDQNSFPFMIFVFISFYYFESLNVLRQFLGISIVFWGTRYIEKEKYPLYVLLVCLAFTIHVSALLGIVVLLFDLLFSNKKSTRKQVLLFISIIFIIAITYYVYLYRYNRYQHYFSDMSITISPILLYKLLLLILIGYLGYEYGNHFSISKDSYSSINLTYFSNYLLGLLLTSLGLLFSFMDRIGLSLMLFELLSWGQFYNISKSRDLVRLLMIIPSVYCIISAFISDGQGVLPYTTIFK